MTAIAFFLSLDLRILREVLDLVKAKILYKVHFNKYFLTDRVIFNNSFPCGVGGKRRRLFVRFSGSNTRFFSVRRNKDIQDHRNNRPTFMLTMALFRRFCR